MIGQDVATMLGLISTGLIAGLFFAWEVSVIPGLVRVGDRAYVQTMQHINRAILNPVFLLPFLLTPAFLVVAAVMADGGAVAWLIAAAVLYAAGVLGVTMTRNVPLNNELEQSDADTSAELVASARHRYETGWNRWNRLRTIAALGSFALAALATLSS